MAVMCVVTRPGLSLITLSGPWVTLRSLVFIRWILMILNVQGKLRLQPPSLLRLSRITASLKENLNYNLSHSRYTEDNIIKNQIHT